ncbi:MAG: bifunctional nuclease family protein [Desulfotomaculaceae bacterium]|nr:bifunctional nuclease family protein [Desulfotomaculaceae bacterium]
MVRLIPVRVKEIAYDVMMNPVVLLIDEDNLKALPIWVGPFEAHAIAIALQGIRLDRPITHDLLKNICDQLDVRLSMVVINDIKENTYYAELHIWRHDRKMVIDSRPSDAIALALRTETPIYLSEKVAQSFLSIKDLFSDEQNPELKELFDPDHQNDQKKSLH